MKTRGLSMGWLSGMALLATAALSAVQAQRVNPDLFSGLVWRNIGPFRAGRVSAVSAAVGQPGVFYAGLPLGGVWKTTSAGETWFPIFDAIRDVSSVGAIEVAPSDPNVIYVGTGDLITGGGINEGNGVYRSVDAGRTWRHLGLDDTKQIPAILVDPRDPNLVLLAAQGNVHARTEWRGVFRSTDGGTTWAKTLYVDDTTGAQAIAWAHDRPSVILATTVRHYVAPGAGRGGAPLVSAPAGGPRGTGVPAVPTGTAIYKSSDEGLTWKEITGGGLPPLAGRTAVAVAANTNAQRMFLVGTFGLYRSDDGGSSWHQVDATDPRIVGNGYICGVYVDPKNPDVVYVMNTSMYRSRDGGNSFEAFKGAPGGDDNHVLWIDPTNAQRLFMGSDQGATVSLDGGESWSSWYNQSTEQVYHISADNSYPYWVYASQQDAGSIATRSRGDLGAITPLDWYPTAGYEWGSPVADPLDPRIVYAGGPDGGIVKITYPSGQWINVSPNLNARDGLRKVLNQPMAWSPANPRELLVGFQFLMATTDGGAHWKRLSPDLTLPKGGALPPPPADAPGGRRGRGPAIESFSASTVSRGTIWVGTTNGMIKLTRNGGATWEDASIPDLPNPSGADISAIDASHQSPATAYVAIDYHTTSDYSPYYYRTRDYGRSWTKIVNGLRTDQPSGSFARVIRADTKRSGLLFAGTESSMYLSFDDGDSWQSLMLNLPNTSYRDIVIKDNDLVVATYGRGIWILDDYSPLRQITPATTAEPAQLFKPGDAIRVRRNVNGDTPFPPEVPHAANPPLGAILYYHLSAKPAHDIALDVMDASGRVIRHLSSAPIPPLPDPPPPVPNFWLENPEPMPVAVGTNRINWNLRYDNPPAFSHNFSDVMGAVAGDTPASPEGPLVLPGIYTLKLTVEGRAYTQAVTVKNDPRSPATAADLRAQHALQMKLYDGARTAWRGYNQVAAMRAAVAALSRSTLPAAVASAAAAFDARLASVGGSAPRDRRGSESAGATPPPPNFYGINGALLHLLETLDFGDMAPNEPMNKAFIALCPDLVTALTTWRTITADELPVFNDVLVKNGVRPITAAPATLAAPVCARAAATPR